MNIHDRKGSLKLLSFRHMHFPFYYRQDPCESDSLLKMRQYSAYDLLSPSIVLQCGEHVFDALRWIYGAWSGAKPPL